MQEILTLTVKKFLDDYAKFTACRPEKLKEVMKCKYDEILELDKQALDSASLPVPESRRKWQHHSGATTYQIPFAELEKVFAPKATPKPRPKYVAPPKPTRAKESVLGKKPKPKPKKF